MTRRAPLIVLLGLLLTLPLACSDTPDGANSGKTGGASSGSGGGTSSGGGSGGGCTGDFCLETDVQITALPQKLIFPDVDVGKEVVQVVRVMHAGSRGDLVVTAATFAPSTDDFEIVDFKKQTVAPGKSFELKIRYKPLKSGNKTLSLVLTNNDNDLSDRKFKVPVLVKAGVGSLKVTPDPIEFGAVASNTCKDVTVKVFNSGAKPIKVTAAKLVGTGSPDFTVKKSPDPKADVAPLTSTEVVLTFCPKPGDDNDTSELQLEDSDGKWTTVKVYGAEIAPRIAVLPPVLKYGAVKRNSKTTRSFKIINQGIADLKVSKIEVSFLSKVKSFTISAPGPFVLKQSEQKLIDVELEALVAMANNGSAVASITITSNDSNKKVVNVPVFAKTESGILQVTPADLLNFAYVGKGLTVKRKVSLFNKGTADVTVSSLSIKNDKLSEFEIVPSTFPPAAINPASHTMKPAEYQSFEVRFTAKGPTNATASGELVIKSDDPNNPSITVKLVAKRAEGAKCDIQLIPGLLNFGILTYGQNKTLAIGVKNVGTGYCAFKNSRMLKCQATSCTLIGIPQFTTFAPSTKLFNLAPGDSAKMNILFNAPNEGGGFFNNPKVLAKFYSALSLEFEDKATNIASWYPNDPKKDWKTIKPNLQASVGEAAVNVLPGSIDFGLVTVGCKSKVEKVSVFNTGITPVFITKLDFQGCGLEMAKVAWPGVPKKGIEVTQAVPYELGLQYAPQNVGKDTCQMVVVTGNEGQCIDAQGTPTASGGCNVTGDCKGTKDVLCSGQTFSVPLKGEGTLLNEFTDEFEQGAGKKVDVLFVIDNSGSMGDEQKNLSDNFQLFIQFATLWQNDYHLGVVTTDMKNATRDKGRLRNYGGTRIVTKNTKDPTGTFKKLAKVGTNGSANEQGLAAAKAALTLPHVYDSGKSCKTDSDCSNGKCVMGPDGNLGCGGHNRGFLRKKAGLEIVFVSDEEDSSPSDLKYYVNFLYSIKGAANKGLFHAHAIVGMGSSGPGNCGAAKGSRYLAVAKDTGGKVASICDKSFGQTLKNIGEAAFGLSQQFFLTMLAEPATLKVTVGGKVCAGSATSWLYDAASNSVTFIAAPKGTCMPKKGDKVQIYYKTLCFP